MRPGRAVLNSARTALSQRQKPPSRRSRVGEFAIGLKQFDRRLPPVETSKQDGGCRFDNGSRRLAQNVGKPHMRRILLQPDCVRQVRVGVIRNDEIRRSSLASESCVDSAK